MFAQVIGAVLATYNPDVLTPPDAAPARYETGNLVSGPACGLLSVPPFRIQDNTIQ